jgi:hypothetical membrane protein
MSRQRTRLLLLAGAVGPLLFWLVVIVDGFTKPGYDARRDFISELALGDHGWVQSANFIVVGLLIIAFAAGLRRLFPAGRASSFGPPLIAIFGLGLFASGIFRTDPGNYPVRSDTVTTTGSIHLVAFLVILGSIIPACFVFARRFRIEPDWRAYGRYSFINGFVIPGMLVLFMLAPDQVTGLTQRALVAAIFLWIELIALRTLALTPRETQVAIPA